MLTPHARQFIITDRPFFAGSDWSSVCVGPELVLSYHQDLPVVRLDENDWLIGSRTIRNGSTCGRYVTLEHGVLKTDCLGLLSVFLLPKSAGGPAIASSDALLAKAYGLRSRESSLRWSGVNWIPLPGSAHSGVVRVLPDQCVDICTGEVANSVQLRPSSARSLREITDSLCEGLVDHSESALHDHRVWLALTAGMDSRTSLAALTYSSVRFQTVTQDLGRKSGVDIGVAVKLSKELRLNHLIVRPLPFSDAEKMGYLEHTSGSVRDADSEVLVPGLQYRFLKRDELLVRSGAFELGRGYYDRRLGRFSIDNARPSDILNAFPESGDVPGASDDLATWLAWRSTFPTGMSLSDDFYRDQRIGGWLAAIEQGLDALPGRSVQLAHSVKVVQALLDFSTLGLPPQTLQTEVIRALHPGLLRTPFNPRPLWKRAGSSVKMRLAGIRSRASLPNS